MQLDSRRGAVGRRAGVWRLIAAAGLILTLGAVVATQLLGDSWWPTMLLLYGPRWVLGVLPALTIPLLIREPRMGSIATVLAFGAFAVGVLDVRMGRGPLTAGEPSLRVVEFNMAGKAGHRGELTAELRALKADAAFLVECSVDAGRALAEELAWNVETTGRLCLLSPHPIRDWAARDQMEFWRRSGSGAVARATLASPAGELKVGIVHLATPRNALETLRDLSELPFRGGVMNANMRLRDDESRAAREWIGGPERRRDRRR